MKFKYNKVPGTFLIGFSFANSKTFKGTKHTNLVFDLGKHSFAFIFRGEY